MASLNWPQNLWEDISSLLPRWAEREYELGKPSVLFSPNLCSVLDAALDERQQKVLRMRYEQGLTYREIGEVFGVGAERVRQIKVSALNELREPKYYLQLCAVPKIEVVRLQSEVKELARQKKELEEQTEILAGQVSKTDEKKATVQKKTPLDAPIGELDLPMRSLTCLTAHGVKTIGELLSYTKSDLQGIRNLGKKSATDIEQALNACGYVLKQEE